MNTKRCTQANLKEQNWVPDKKTVDEWYIGEANLFIDLLDYDCSQKILRVNDAQSADAYPRH